ncbi:MAG TPA: endolytic transglycosylase MltG [Coriobacteriia bacterium]|nr:endolytic transglycosylase MltG [Coriobacteriia bacterium]
MKHERRSAGSHILAAILLIAVVLAVAVIVTGYFTLFRPQVQVAAGQPVTVEVAKGAGTTSIAELLAERGVVSNANKFRLEVKRAEADGKLRAGVYELATGMPDDVVIEKLLAGPAVAYTTVTIPEGWRVSQIARRLEDKAGIPSDEFEELALGGADQFSDEHPYLRDAYKGSLEGFLFPKTYRLREGATASDAIEMMLDQFDKEITSVDVEAAKKRDLSLSELVNVASIIERETKLAKERRLVSSVIRNRLKIGMRLQMCSTVVYVLDKNELRLTEAETRTESPYNTYLHTGLPPGPIASPGLASLKAAAKPADTDYIYYVLTGKDGSHTFAASNSEFLRAKQKSKEVFGE